MRPLLLLILILTAPVIAKDIAPKEPPVVPVLGQVIDRSRPEFVPQFLKSSGPSQLQIERDWAIQNTLPPIYIGAFLPIRTGCYGYVPYHGFYR